MLYQIYPQSFADGNGDGIGDLRGITEHLDYLAWLGVTAVWLNPCFASPMRDAGYDVADYLTIAPRYGDNDDLAKLADEARARGIRVLLDLVAGHTSDTHPWFTASADDPGDHRYIWAPGAEDGQLPQRFVHSPGTRPGGYLPNFFDFQPALNFGYARQQAGERWRQSPEADGPAGQPRGAAHDHGLLAAAWRVRFPGRHGLLAGERRSGLRRDQPAVARGAQVARPGASGRRAAVRMGRPGGGRPRWVPRRLLPPLRRLGQREAAALAVEQRHRPRRPGVGTGRPAFFDADGLGDPGAFLSAYQDALTAIGGPGHIALPTANHDFARLHAGPRTAEQLPAAFAFLLTFPTLPAIYYGDEIGMRHVPGLPDVEGSISIFSSFNRAGSRTPMQWDSSPNAGFSVAPGAALYLPIDPDPGRPTVSGQRADQDSLLHTVRDLIALRRAHPELGPGGRLEILHDEYPLAYLRGGRFLVVVNPSGRARAVPHDRPELAAATAVRQRRRPAGPGNDHRGPVLLRDLPAVSSGPAGQLRPPRAARTQSEPLGC